ncbi:SpoIIE-like protein phosphatase domain protein [Bacteriovorax sp. BAL6_X]|uniref:SpoIIE family protein phosphatase n=1 Tax=Bacteriovorax sp. BAL6_X TaxID=1201290 RepID=UPI00038596EE|nr:SpoIIE family protein phosphatase [Bacteriovorax sp. BAL6_X]EPZ49984.1 SpoIIE-like protein phosphatase domain protein [Bacteriovorax sp. BAL6_X]
MGKRPTFPIKLKLISLNTALLIIVIAFLTKYATHLFEKDKKAYLYENSLFNVTSVAKEINYTLNKIENDLQNLALIKNNKLRAKAVAESKYILAFVEKNQFIINKDFEKNENDFKLAIPKDTRDNSLSSFKYKDDLFVILTKKVNKGLTSIVIKANILNNLLSQNRTYNTIVFKDGSLVLGNDLIGLHNYDKSELKGNNIVKKVSFNEDDYLVSLAQTKAFALSIVSTISESDALSVTKFLVQRAIFFAIFIIALSTIIIILLSKTISKPIEKLYQRAISIGQGDFESTVEIKTRDELGTLGDSFNQMSREILEYIEKMKEKARLDEEVKVAKMVQEEFFPPKDIDTHYVRLSSYAAPASECGGDWWGHYEFNEYIITIIADATGHGLPAALLTSAINSAFNSIKIRLSEDGTQISPALITSHLNKVINLSNNKILLTAFVSVYNTKTKEYSYTNASHLEVLKVPKKSEISKADILPLLEAKGPRLGESCESKYDYETIILEQGDLLVYMTDGITEAENSDGKQWGLRNLLKILMTYGDHTGPEIRDTIVSIVHNHRGSNSFDDDLTLICQEIK